MSKQSREAERLDSIRSVSLEDIVNGRHTRWRRFQRRVRRAMPLASLVTLALAAGSAAYFVVSGPDENTVLASVVDPQTTGSLPSAEDRDAAAVAVPQAAAGPDALARLPRPRPDEPPGDPMILTGSIAQPMPATAYRPAPPPAAAPAYRPSAPQQQVYVYRSRSCRAMEAMARYIPLRVRCAEVRRIKPPPHARYVPGPPYVEW